MRILLLLTALLLGFHSLSGQQLKRPGTLGIYPAALSATEALNAGLDGLKGVRVAKVIPGSSAEKIGIQVGDLVLQVNGATVESPSGIVAQLGALSAGEEIALTIVRAEKEINLRGLMGTRALPLAANANISFGEVPFEGGHLRSFFEKPQGEGPFPVIYFLQGYTCQSIEYANPNHPLRKLVNQWVDNGYAVYRIEKPGVGDSEGTPECGEINFDTELAAFRAGYQALLKEKEVDIDRLFVYGHSLGGVVAPFLASEFAPAGVMVYGFVLKSWKDYMFDMQWEQRIRMKDDPGDAMADVQAGRKLLNAYFDEMLAPSAFLQTDQDRALFADIMSYDGGEHCFGRHYTFWQTIDKKNLPLEWQKVNCPVLSMYGEYDLAAIDNRAARQLADLINLKDEGKGTFLEIEKTNHSLLKMSDFEEQLTFTASPNKGIYYQNNFNEQYAEALMEWMDGVLGNAR